MTIAQRMEGTVIPEGICVTEGACRVHIYIRQGDQIATIKLPKPCWKGSDFTDMRYEILSKE